MIQTIGGHIILICLGMAIYLTILGAFRVVKKWKENRELIESVEL